MSTIDVHIDDELFERLRREAEKCRCTVGELISRLLRQSMTEKDDAAQERPRFTVKAKALHALPQVDFNSISRLLDSLNEERYPG